MKKNRKVLLPLALMFTTITPSLMSCDNAGNVKYNITQDADSFRTYRRVTVMNLRSDKVLLEIEGYISIKDSTSSELAIVVKTGPDDYYMHYVYTGSEIVYLVEQLEPTSTNPYEHKIRIYVQYPKIELGE